MLGLTDPFAVFTGQSVADNPDEINIDIESEGSETTDTQESKPVSPSSSSAEPSADILSSQSGGDSSQSEAALVETDADSSQLDSVSTPDNTYSGEFPTFIQTMTPASSDRSDIITSSSIIESSASPVPRKVKSAAAKQTESQSESTKRHSTEMEQTTSELEVLSTRIRM